MILVLSDLWVPFPGGAERLMFNLARELQRAGEDIRVVTGYHPAQAFDGPHPMPLSVPENDEGAELLFRAIRMLQPDVILTHHYWALTFEDTISEAARDAHIVQVVLNGRRLESATLAVYISDYVARTVGGYRATDLVIYPPAFPDVVAETHGHAIGFIKPIHHKGVDLFYEIAARMPDYRFVVLRGEWQDLEDIRPAPNIEFMEPVDDIRRFYERVEMVIVPSISEDGGTVGQECALNRIPCISSNVGGLPETNRGGVLVLTREPEHWVTAMRRLLDNEWLYIGATAAQAILTPTTQAEQIGEFVTRMRALQE